MVNPALKVGGKKDRTRAVLIDAAWEVILERGIAGASLDVIARRAGMTKGAVYSNFAARADLLAAVREAKAPKLSPRFEVGATLGRQMHIAAESILQGLSSTEAEARFIGEYHLYAQTDPDFRKMLVAEYDRLFDRGEQFFAAYADEIIIPVHDLMVIIQSMVLGFVRQSLITPEDITRDVVIAAFAALAVGISRPGAGKLDGSPSGADD